jgi:hypothetical protein
VDAAFRLVTGGIGMRLEPDWWPRARRLSEHGVPTARIAKTMGRSKSSVLYCLNPRVREKAIAASSRRWAAAPSSAGRPYDGERQKIRRLARDECRAAGNCTPAALRVAYQQFNCL